MGRQFIRLRWRAVSLAITGRSDGSCGLEGDIGDLGLNGNGASHFAATNFDTSSATDADFYYYGSGQARYRCRSPDDLRHRLPSWEPNMRMSKSPDTCTSLPATSSKSARRTAEFRSGSNYRRRRSKISSGAPWTAKAQYLYYDLGNRTLSGLAGGAGPRFSSGALTPTETWCEQV